MESEELSYWLALKEVNGVGIKGFKSLLESFDSPDKAFKASFQELVTVPGIGPKTASRIKRFNDWHKIEDDLKRLKQLSIKVITFHDRSYPAILKNIYDYPALLYVKGSLEVDDLNIALVGSRMASTYGKFVTERLARELSLNGITVVSGLARGIDSAAHRGALAGRGRTIAVLGCGIDVVYPPENGDLYRQIGYRGAVISEFPPGTPPNASNFPLRNRIISGLSLGVVVVEANERSGSLITARIALEQGREVFAVPGNIDYPGSRGSHRLIKEGANLIESVDDILEVILPQIQRKQSHNILNDETGNREIVRRSLPVKKPDLDAMSSIGNLSEKEKVVFESLTSAPLDVDSIIEKSGLSVNETLNCLLNLELNDLITQLPGKLYKLKEPPCRIP